MNIWDVRLNGDTKNYGGLEWVIDGEDGRKTYPGCWAECKAREYYLRGWEVDHPFEIGMCEKKK